MRHTSFFDEIVDRGHFIERLMNAFCKIEEHIFSQMLMKEGFIMDYIQVVIDELLRGVLLQRSIMLLILGHLGQINRCGILAFLSALSNAPRFSQPLSVCRSLISSGYRARNRSQKSFMFLLVVRL